ncbi:hypothetical protein DPMN_014181 [Dreissena polymorpha]|uniref:Uncharacterized protein n=1 Tax=Dreissena polymorpha TaxID=45954 RepID=A0A9D4N995_DREPO|nr:hypothetical protein DPMN_014181 [Dreissena polymorpha]
MPRLLGGHVFQPTGTILESIQYIIGTNLLTKIHEDQTINVASRKNVPPPGGHVFKAANIIRTNLKTMFHDDWKINVTSRLLTMFYNSHIRKNAPPPWRPFQYIIRMNLLTKFHYHWTINMASRVQNKPYLEKCPAPWKPFFSSKLLTKKNVPPPGGHVFLPNDIIFELVQHIIQLNFLTKFHEDWKINVASRVLTRKNAPPLGSHVFQANVTIFKLVQNIIETNLLTKFHEDWK